MKKNINNIIYSDDNINTLVDIENYLIPEMLKLENNKNSGNTIILLIITVFVFFSTKIINTNIVDVLILIVALLFHELGHLVMMKVFRYNDLKIFFIPFFGAAVSGNNKSESVVKSSIVSMMGPLPGIIFAVISYYLFGITKNYIFLKLCGVMLLLNTFNLLPILPLDGGRYIEVLFYKSKLGRLLFSIFGILIFIIIGLMLQDYFLIIIGILSIMRLVPNYKTMGIAIKYENESYQYKSVKEMVSDKDNFKNIIIELVNTIPKVFIPNIKSTLIYSNLESICSYLRMKTTKLAVKIALFILYLLIFVISIIITLFYFGMNYNEVNTIKQMDNKSIYYNQIYIFGKLNSEIPIDDNEYFNGEAIMYSSVDSSILKNKYYYENGFRTGVWYEYDNSGELKEIREYNNGKLVYIELYRNGAAKKIMFNEMGVLKKIVEEISRLSLPRKSLASKFK